MKLRYFRLDVRQKTILAIMLVLLWFFVRHRALEMDGRFFRYSLEGAKGLILYELGDYSGAAKAYRGHLRVIHKSKRPSGERGYHALLRGDLQSAKKLSKEALEKNPSALGSLLTLGEVLLEDGALGQAQKTFDLILQEKTDQSDALLLSSVAYTRSRAYGEAIEALNRVLRHGGGESRETIFLKVLEVTGDLNNLKNDEKPFCLLAQYYRYLRIYDSSNGRITISYANKAIAADDRPDDAYLAIGIVYDKRGKQDKALSSFLKAIEINPQNGEAFRWAGNVYSKRGDLLNEYKMKIAALENSPKDSFYIKKLNHYLVKKIGDYPRALEANLKFLQTNKDNVDVLEWVGYIYRLMGNQKKSLEYYKKALSLEPDNPHFFEEIGYQMTLMGQIDEGIIAFQKALSIDSGRAYSHYFLGYAYSLSGNYSEAIKEYQVTLLLDNRNVGALHNLCGVYYRIADFSNSVKCLEHVLLQDSSNKIAKHELGHTLSLLNP